MALVWSTILALAAICAHFWSPALYVVSVTLVGGLQNHISSLIHHAIHTNVHPNKKINDWITRLCLTAPQGQLFSALRSEHLHHHRKLGAADDPERYYYDLRLHQRSSMTGFVTWAAKIFAGWLVIPALSRLLLGSRGPLGEAPLHANRGSGQDRMLDAAKRDKRLDLLVVPPVQAVLFLLYWLITGDWWAYFAFWVLPLVTVGAAFNALRATIEHANPDEHATADDPRDILFSFVSNPLERFFICPLQFNYHYEHHRFMSVPYYHAPKLRKLLMDRNDYDDVTLVPSYAHRILEICRRLRERSASGVNSCAARPGDSAPD